MMLTMLRTHLSNHILPQYFKSCSRSLLCCDISGSLMFHWALRGKHWSRPWNHNILLLVFSVSHFRNMCVDSGGAPFLWLFFLGHVDFEYEGYLLNLRYLFLCDVLQKKWIVEDLIIQQEKKNHRRMEELNSGLGWDRKPHGPENRPHSSQPQWFGNQFVTVHIQGIYDNCTFVPLQYLHRLCTLSSQDNTCNVLICLRTGSHHRAIKLPIQVLLNDLHRDLLYMRWYNSRTPLCFRLYMDP